MIYFTEDQGSRLSRVGAQGGAPSEVVTTLPVGHHFGEVLPDSKRALVTAFRRGISGDYADIVLMSLDTFEKKVLVQSGYDARYVAPGYLVFARDGSLMAVRVDIERAEVFGEPVPVAEDVAMESLFGQVHAAISDNGLLVYVPGGDRALGRLAWVDRRGAIEFVDAPPRVYGVVDLSADGHRLAVHVADVNDYVWIYDLTRREGRRLSGMDNSGWPVWSPDGLSIAFSSGWDFSGDVVSRVLTRAVEGGTAPMEVASGRGVSPSSWLPDGRGLALDGFGAGQLGFRVGFVSLGGSVEWFKGPEGNPWGPYFSPNGRWIAYGSDETGQYEVWVRSHPDGGAVRQISVDGGVEPMWCRCGELFYRTGNRWMASRVSLQPDLSWEPPRLAFETDFIDTPGRSYAVSPDGRRLLVVKRAVRETPTKLHLVSNWVQELERASVAK